MSSRSDQEEAKKNGDRAPLVNSSASAADTSASTALGAVGFSLCLLGVVAVSVTVTWFVLTSKAPTGGENECYNGVCLNGAVCRNMPDSYQCTCTRGYTGRHCEEKVTACTRQPCLNNGQCTPQKNDTFTCTCRQGYTGKLCDVDIEDCVNSTLCGSFTCVNTPGSFRCVCPRGYTGAHCDVDIDECLDANTCHDHGRCVNVVGSYGCVCNQGYSATDDCELPTSPAK